MCTSQVRLKEFQEQRWVNRQTAAASQIRAQDVNTAPTYAQLTAIQRLARGFWKSSCGTQRNSIQCGQAQSHLPAVLVDRPGSNILYSYLPLVAITSVLLKWILISKFVGLSYQASPHRFRTGKANASPLPYVSKIENAHFKDLKQLYTLQIENNAPGTYLAL